MKTLEEILDILSLKRQGYSERGIARKLGIHRKTVKKYLENPDWMYNRTNRKRDSKLDPYVGNIEAWLGDDILHTATWIYDHLVSLGFDGSYEIVKRRVKAIKTERSRLAYIRFETEPGYQAQVDFGEFQVLNADGTIDKYYLFSMILGYSRRIYAELIRKCDLPTFLDCHIRAFEYFGGVPQEILYDRMKNVYIGKIAGKQTFNTTLTGFALHYGFSPRVAPAYAAWVKGKVERPFSFIREGFWRGYGFINLETANRDLQAWLKKKDERVHGTTHEVVSRRFLREQPYLQSLPHQAFDTSYRIYRKVHKDCTVRFEGNSYVVPHLLVGKHVVLRVKDNTMRVFDNDHFIVAYIIPEGKGHLVQDKRFYEALRRDNEMNARKYHHAGAGSVKGRAKQTISPLKPLYEMDVEIRPVSIYDHVCGGGL
jgi:transposase